MKNITRRSFLGSAVAGAAASTTATAILFGQQRHAAAGKAGRVESTSARVSAVRYAPPGWYLKDHCFFFQDGLWHLFAPLGKVGTSWEDPGSEETAEHMTSPDLLNWKHVGTAVSNSGKAGFFDKMMGGIAPYVIEHDGKFYMFYAGWTFSSKRPNFDLAGCRHSIGLATSGDLTRWEKPEESAKDGLGVRGTDQCVVRDEANDRWLMYTWTGQIPVYKSNDLLHWSQAGIAVTKANLFGIGESPFVMKHPRSGKWIIFLNDGYAMSDDPLRFPRARRYPFKCGWHGVPGVKPSGAWGDGTNALADDDGAGYAHEMIEFRAQWYMTGVVGRDGRFKLKFTPFRWTDDFMAVETNIH